jgi:hypothetical protein
MTVERPPKEEKSDLDKALEDLLVGEVRVKIDPTTGRAISPHGEKSTLTDSPDPNTIR